jgi:hypothetical protein
MARPSPAFWDIWILKLVHFALSLQRPKKVQMLQL